MTVSVPVSVNVPTFTICDLLVGAVEGGSNYWATFRLDPNFAKLVGKADLDETSKLRKNLNIFPMYNIEHPQYCLRVSDAEGGTTYNVTLESFVNGLNVMADRYPQHFKDVITENYDAVTSDVFIQCAVFGEIVFC